MKNEPIIVEYLFDSKDNTNPWRSRVQVWYPAFKTSVTDWAQRWLG